jgi:hypothetical protein
VNIFVLSEHPAQAARYHADKHVVKMILESAQILNGALYERGLDDLAFYGYTHKNHPCTLWAAESWSNFEWLVQLMHYLNKEYKLRYDHDESHTSYQKMVRHWREDGEWIVPTEPEPRTPYALAVPDDVKQDNPVLTYRDYYREYKSSEDWFGYERGRDEPKWLSS